MDPLEEERLIERCRVADFAAYRQIYDRYGQPLLRTAVRMLRTPQEAEDAVQETFLKLFRGIGGFRRGSRLSTYLFQILHNTCLDMLRKRKRAAQADVDAETLAAPSTHELSHSLAEALDGLPPGTRIQGSARTEFGKIISDFPALLRAPDSGEGPSVVFENAPGAVTLKLETSSSDITIKKE